MEGHDSRRRLAVAERTDEQDSLHVERLKRLRTYYTTRVIDKEKLAKKPRPSVVVAVATVETLRVSVEVTHVTMTIEYETTSVQSMPSFKVVASDATRMFNVIRKLEDLLDVRHNRAVDAELRICKSELVACLHLCDDSRPYDEYCKWLCHFCDMFICLSELKQSRRNNLSRDDCRLAMHRLRVFATKMIKLGTVASAIKVVPKLLGPETLCVHFLNIFARDIQDVWGYFAHNCKAFAQHYDLDDMLEWVEDMTFAAHEFSALYTHCRFWSDALVHMAKVKKRTHENRWKAIRGSPHFSPPHVPITELDL